MYTWDVVWDECSEEESQRIECTERSVVRGVWDIWDIVRRTKRKQVPSWDPRQHVECWGPFTEIESSRLDFQLSTHMTVKWMGHGWDMKIEFNELGFCVWKTSSKNSVYVYGNRVQQTRFLYIETEFFELDFYVLSTSVSHKSSLLDSNC